MSLVYSCDANAPPSDSYAVWILSRTPTLPSEYPYDKLLSTLTGLDIDVSTMAPGVQGPQCKYD